MGDRANVYVKNSDTTGVYLYTHWGGYELPTLVRAALAKRWRWSDDAYLTRIVFDTMTKGFHGEETGFGIATYQPDNEHLIIMLDCTSQEVQIGEAVWSFEEFVNLSDADLALAWEADE